MIGGRLEAFFTVPSATTVTATNSGGASTSVSLTAGLYTATSFCAHLQARLNAVRTPATWTVTLSTGTSGTGLVTIDCVGETWALTFTTALAGTVLGFVGNIASTTDPSVGTNTARGVCLLDCPLTLDGDPARAPKNTDNRSSESPSGLSITLGGTKKYVHRNLRWTHVTRTRMYTGTSSLRQWFDDTQFGDGHAWFSRGSAFQVYWSNAGTDEILGSDLNSGAGPTAGWTLAPAVAQFEPGRTSEGWLGMCSFTFPRIVSAG